MTEFTSKTYNGQTEFEVIIRTDREEHYKHAEDFARKLIDHAKPQTNGDRIRAMSDEELADYFGKQSYYGCPSVEKCDGLCHGCWTKWLKEPVKEEPCND